MPKLLEILKEADEKRKAGKLGHASFVVVSFAWDALPTCIAELEDYEQLREDVLRLVDRQRLHVPAAQYPTIAALVRDG